MSRWGLERVSDALLGILEFQLGLDGFTGFTCDSGGFRGVLKRFMALLGVPEGFPGIL